MSETNVNSWKALRLTLGKQLKPEGKSGFEGLVASLFAAETGHLFYLARTGDQPAGDAYSSRAGVALQAKRYRTAKIAENNVEGDIERTIRETPNTDIFVVVSTRADNQLKLRLEKKTEETGVDLLLFALDDALSPFGALCVSHWSIVRAFLPNLDDKSDVWAEAQRQSTEAEKALSQLRREMTGLTTRTIVSEQARTKLQSRFTKGALGVPRHNSVDIADGIQRTGLRRMLQNWLINPDALVAVLEGEEGTGKTWIAADFASDLPGENPIVFWLDSIVWCGAKTVEDVVNCGLATVLPPGDQRLPRVRQKIFRRWSDPVLIVLDGANERGAWDAAGRLLRDIHQHASALRGRVRVLFTSRPALHQLRIGRNFWSGTQMVPVGPFDDVEFASAMEKFAPDVPPETLTDAVRELAKLPSYFRICIQLRDRLASFTHLNRELLLWADLEAKIDHGDPQWLGIQEELGGTASQILAHLAEKIGWPVAEAISVTTTELQQHLPGFAKVRSDLMEQRIVLSANPSETMLSGEHLVLGWALLLQRVAEQHANEDADALCDRLHRLLEPGASNDCKARAVHLAALLTFLNEGAAVEATRVGLFRLWLLHHNASVTSEALGFFVRNDLSAYLSVVEILFREYLPGNFETCLITPLAALWRDCGTDLPALTSALERWLRLIFPGDASGSQTRDQTPPPCFVPAQSPIQLRLSYAACGIISFRPTIDMLPALFDCFHSDSFCYGEHGTPPNSAWFPVKSSMEPLGLLARWHYGEAALPEIAKLAEGVPPAGERAKTLNSFTRLWRMVQLPSILGEAKDIRSIQPADDEALFADLRKILSSAEPSKRDPFGLGIGRLAVRRDLPNLNIAEIVRIIAEANARLALADRRGFINSREGHAMDDLLPFLGRYSRVDFTRVVHTLWKVAVSSNDTTQRLFVLDEYLPPHDDGGELVEDIQGNISTLLNQQDGAIAAARLTEVMLLHADTATLLAWFEALAPHTLERSGGPIIGLLPIPMAIAELAPKGFDAATRSAFEKALQVFEQTPTAEARKRARHWLVIYANVVTEPTPEIGAWAIDLADRHDEENNDFCFALFLLVSRCGDGTILRRALRHPIFSRYQLGFNSWRWANAFPNGTWPIFTWSELKQYTSFTVAGWLLHRSSNENELRDWGRDMSAAALAAVSGDSLPLPKSNLEVRIGRDGRLNGIGFELPQGGKHSFVSTSSPAWGIDRHINQPAFTDEENESLNDSFQNDLEALRASSRREFVEFNAAGPLNHWSRIAPEFVEWAKRFLKLVAASDLSVRFEMAYFIDTVSLALFRLEPEFVLDKPSQWSGEPHVRILGCGGKVLSRVEAVWDSELNTSPPVVAERRRLLLDAHNDEEILWQVVAAHFRGNDAAIAAMASDWMRSAAARERALAVTLLAFRGEEESLAILAKLRECDPSLWVREHARWGEDVCSTELVCRCRYRELLIANSLEDVVSGLAEMRPALSPMAIAWRNSDEHQNLLALQNPRNRAAIRLFWHHRDSSSSNRSNIKLVGRKLGEYCCGEPLKEGVSSHMAPWWKLDHV